MILHPLSLQFFGSIDPAMGVPLALAARVAFNHNDAYRNRSDPSKCDWVMQFPGDARGWSAKGSIDADGPAVGPGYWDGVAEDPPDGQVDTTLRFANGRSLPSEGCPYAVLPGGDFPRMVGLSIGDVGIVIYQGQITAAVLGDIGPGVGQDHNNPKIGEYSIRVHNSLRPAAPDPCHRDEIGRCVRIRDVSIDHGVVFIGFPGVQITDLALETCQQQIENAAFGVWRALGGFVPENN